jgi:hypothetical protein
MSPCGCGHPKHRIPALPYRYVVLHLIHLLGPKKTGLRRLIHNRLQLSGRDPDNGRIFGAVAKLF